MPRTPHTMPSMPCIDTSLLCWFQKLREKTEELDVISQYKQEIQKLEVVFFRLSCLAYEYTSWGGGRLIMWFLPSLQGAKGSI